MSNESEFDANTIWHTSSRCNNGNCVEVAALPSHMIGVRDNKDPQSPVLRFSAAEWESFVRRVKERP